VPGGLGITPWQTGARLRSARDSTGEQRTGAVGAQTGRRRRRWAWHAGPGRERSWVLLGELARHEPGAGTDAAPSVLRVVVPRHVATAAALGLGGEQLGIDAGGLAERARVKEPAVACP
jgi:hypothetical protein